MPVFDVDSSQSTIAAARDALGAHVDAHYPWLSRADVLLAASELLTNAHRHAGGWWSMRMAAEDDEVRLSVRDGGARLPAPREPALTGAGGLGWHIVQRLADRVDVEPLPDGKAVHACWRVPAAEPAAPAPPRTPPPARLRRTDMATAYLHSTGATPRSRPKDGRDPSGAAAATAGQADGRQARYDGSVEFPVRQPAE